MRDVLDTLEAWADERVRVATATVVAVERSAPRPPGAVLALSERGDVAGSVTGGCVEPAVIEEARAVLAGGPPRLLEYGIPDDDAFDVGLPCGGTVRIFVDLLDAAILVTLVSAIRSDTPVALETVVEGADAGAKRIVPALTDTETVLDDGIFVHAFLPRPQMYLFGATPHAAALAHVGRLLGYRVTVCDARAKLATRERLPHADEVVVDWPDRFLERAPVDGRTVVCVFTHDPKFDVSLLRAALATPAGYIGAMGSRRVTASRAERLRAEGCGEEEIARIHAPIGLPLGARTPEEVAVAVAAEIVAAANLKECKALPA